MEDTPAYRLDIEALNKEAEDTPLSSSPSRRPWVGIRFDCCGMYVRVYRNAESTEYLGRCPRCGKRVRLRVGEGGTDARFFVAE